MFRKQFSLIAQEEEALKELCVFVIQVHIEACFTAGKAIEAPHRNLGFESIPSSTFQQSIFHTISQKMSKHLW